MRELNLEEDFVASDIGAVIVADGGKPAGIITKRVVDPTNPILV